MKRVTAFTVAINGRAITMNNNINDTKNEAKITLFSPSVVVSPKNWVQW